VIEHPSDELKARIRSDVPTWPTAVTDIWLANIAVEYGWPPDEEAWRYVLRRKSFEQWKKIAWKEDKISLSLADLCSEARRLIMGLLEAAAGRKNDYSSVLNSRQRLHSLTDFAYHHGTYPHPVLLFRSTHGLQIVDGSHRLASLFLIQHFHSSGTIRPGAHALRERHDVIFAGLPHSWH